MRWIYIKIEEKIKLEPEGREKHKRNLLSGISKSRNRIASEVFPQHLEESNKRQKLDNPPTYDESKFKEEEFNDDGRTDFDKM